MSHRVQGKVYVVPNAAEKSWTVVVHNTGALDIGLTHNIFRTKAEAETSNQHDDHGNYGHGIRCYSKARGMVPVSTLKFQKDDTYNGLPIAPDQFLRLGLRGSAYTIVKLPKLDGEPVEVDLSDFNWYGGGAGSDTGNMDHYAAQARKPPEANRADGNKVLQDVMNLIAAAKTGIRCQGQVSVTAVSGADGKPSRWDVRFDNSGATPWIGTVAFEGHGKRDGAGLESMACPGQGTAAVQSIDATKSYGALPAPGTRLRVGIRAYGFATLALPRSGTAKVDIAAFTRDASQFDPQWFAPHVVEDKRTEKVAAVDFYENGVLVNDKLKPVTHVGAKAREVADYPPPHVEVRSVASSVDYPGGGWVVKLTSTLPKADEKQREISFVATLKLGDDGYDPAALPPRKLLATGNAVEWFIPKCMEVNGVVAQSGNDIVVGTRGLGWELKVALPKAKGSFDSDKEDRWAFREDQARPQRMEPAYVKKTPF